MNLNESYEKWNLKLSFSRGRKRKMKEIHIEVKGRVQGVGFRDGVKGHAEELGLRGFVMNNKDGSASILAQGHDDKLESFFAYVQKNPGFSKVDSLNYRKEKIGKKYPNFKIVREGSFLYDQLRSFYNLGRFFIGVQGEVPNHVAIIPDGNRRWATGKGFEGTFGHYKSGAYKNLDDLFREGRNIGVRFMSIWGFSTENWKRGEREKKEIFDLILSGVGRFLKDAEKNKIRFRHIGRKERLPNKLRDALIKLEKKTEKFDEFNVQLCLDYGGRDELIRAVNKIKNKKGKVSEKDFEMHLDSVGVPDVDLIIRTSGEQRLSGFMPYQSIYAELYFSQMHFPDFGVKELRKAVREYGRRQRRFGGN
jgi:undecaprenyl diphosphate synthase